MTAVKWSRTRESMYWEASSSTPAASSSWDVPSHWKPGSGSAKNADSFEGGQFFCAQHPGIGRVMMEALPAYRYLGYNE